MQPMMENFPRPVARVNESEEYHGKQWVEQIGRWIDITGCYFLLYTYVGSLLSSNTCLLQILHVLYVVTCGFQLIMYLTAPISTVLEESRTFITILHVVDASLPRCLCSFPKYRCTRFDTIFQNEEKVQYMVPTRLQYMYILVQKVSHKTRLGGMQARRRNCACGQYS